MAGIVGVLSFYRQEVALAEKFTGYFGLITAFYVLGNFNNPRETLKILSKYSNRSGNIVIEVPSVNDVL